MTEKKSLWWRDLLIIPLVVGIVVAIATYTFPKIFEKGKELSYSLDGPTTYIDLTQPNIGDITVEVNGKVVSQLYIYKVRIWNSGSTHLSDIAVRFVFNTDDADFEIFSINHNTTPRYEFGEITEETTSKNAKRFVYELLNPDNEDLITFVTNDLAELTVYAKSEDLSLRYRANQSENISALANVMSAITGLIALFGSFLGLSLDKLRDLKFFKKIWEEKRDSSR